MAWLVWIRVFISAFETGQIHFLYMKYFRITFFQPKKGIKWVPESVQFSVATPDTEADS